MHRVQGKNNVTLPLGTGRGLDQQSRPEVRGVGREVEGGRQR